MIDSKITQEEISKYLKRYEGTIPLVIYPPKIFPRKCEPTLIESDIELKSGLHQIQDIKSNKEYKILAGFEKSKLKDFINFDWLQGGYRMPDLFNKRLVDKMQNICPNDFIALPVTLINLSDKVETYKNTDFYVVNALNTIDAIDKEKSIIYTYSTGTERVEKKVYKEDPWQGHFIAFDRSTLGMIYHPELAKELYPSKQFQFITPEEDSHYIRGGFPDGYNKETWFNWLVAKNAMTYPKARVYKLMQPFLRVTCHDDSLESFSKRDSTFSS